MKTKKIISIGFQATIIFPVCILFISLWIISCSKEEDEPAKVYLINDDFENYTENTFPSSGGWILKYNGKGDDSQIISKSQAHSGSKSFQLVGRYSWSSVAYYRLSSPPEVVFFEAWIKTSGNECLIDFSNRDEGTWGTGYANVLFVEGAISCSIGGTGQNIQAFDFNVWYKVKLKYNSIDSSISVWINDEQKVTDLKGTVSSAGYCDLSLMSGWNAPVAYFDDVKVWYEQ
jgi:hypothetical protein